MASSHATRRISLYMILALGFFATLGLLIILTLVNAKDINDTWILEGLFPIFLLFTMIYVTIVGFSVELKPVAVFTSVYLCVINLIPLLKYVFIYGFYDPLPHYQFIQGITSTGNIPDSGFYAAQYGMTPGAHISVSELSLVAGLSPLLAMKVFLSVQPFVIPLVLYFVLKKLNTPTGLSKIIIVATIVTSPTLYRYTGTVAVFTQYILFVCFWLLFASRGNDTRSNFVVAILLWVSIVISHDVTSFFLIICMLAALILFRFRGFADWPVSVRFLCWTVVLIGLAYLTLVSTINLGIILRVVNDAITALFSGRTPGAVEYYGGFFELTLIQKVQVIVVRMGKDILSIFLLTLAPIAIFRLKIRDKNLSAFYYALAFLTIPAFLTFLLPLFVRSYIINRGLIYLGAFSPFLVGTSIYWLVYSKHYRFKDFLSAVFMFSLVLVSILQLYPCQPLIPKVNSSYGSYYVTDLRAVNSIYDRSAIGFLSKYDLQLTITTDYITRFQIYGLTEPPFHNLLVWGTTKAQLILVSFDGTAHIIPSGRAAIDHAEYMWNAIQENGVIYTNSKSFVLLNFEGH